MYKSIVGKILKSLLINTDFESWKLLYSSQMWLLGQTTKQPLSNFEPKNLENISNFKGWGMTLVVYKKNKCIFHLMCLTNPSFQPSSYNVGWHLFCNWCKAIKWLFLFPVPKNATKMCVWVCVCVSVRKVSPMLKINSTTDNGFFFLPL